MSYYNNAALIGGWSTANLPAATANSYDAWKAEALSLVQGEKGLYSEILGHLQSTYGIDSSMADNVIALAYIYDSSIINQDPSARRMVRDYINQTMNPAAYTKALRYVRQRIHRGATRRARRTRADRINEILLSRANRNAKRTYLQGSKWYGSDPFVGRSRIGTYKNIITPTIPRRQRTKPMSQWEQRFRQELAAALGGPLPAPTWNYDIVAPYVQTQSSGTGSAVTRVPHEAVTSVAGTRSLDRLSRMVESRRNAQRIARDLARRMAASQAPIAAAATPAPAPVVVDEEDEGEEIPGGDEDELLL